MTETLEERKSRLEAEIRIAQNLLIQNIDALKMSNYLPKSSGIFSRITQNPGTTISTLLSLGSMFLSKKNKIGRLMNIYNIIVPFLKQK